MEPKLDLNDTLIYNLTNPVPVKILDTNVDTNDKYHICFKTRISKLLPETIRFMDKFGNVKGETAKVVNVPKLSLEIGKHYRLENSQSVYIFYKNIFGDSYLGVVDGYNNIIRYSPSGRVEGYHSYEYNIVGEI